MTDAALADANRQLDHARRDPTASAYWAWVGRPWHIVLASSPDYAPLYLALDGLRQRWTPIRTDAEPFSARGVAQSFAADEVQSAVRIVR